MTLASKVCTTSAGALMLVPMHNIGPLKINCACGWKPGKGFARMMVSSPTLRRLVPTLRTRLHVLGGSACVACRYDLYAEQFRRIGVRSSGQRLNAFYPKAGIKSVGFVLGATYQLSDTTSLQVYDKFDRLVGDAANSPIVTNLGSANQNTVGFVLSRSF